MPGLNEMVKLNVILDLSAQKIMHQMHLHNEMLEDQVKKGLELAIAELSKEDVIVNYIKDDIVHQIKITISQHVLGYEMKNKIQKMVSEKIETKLSAYADIIAEKIVESLK